MNFNDLSRIINQALNIYNSINRPYNNRTPVNPQLYQSASVNGWKGKINAGITPGYPPQGQPIHYYYLDQIKAFLNKEI